MSTESRFVQVFKSWLVSLPHDLKVAFEAMDDENLARGDRELAAGVIIYVVSPNDAVKDRNESIGSFADDALLLRLALRRIGRRDTDDAKAFRERFADMFDTLDEEVAVCSSVMGDLMPWLEEKVETLRKLELHGKKIDTFLDDDEARAELYEDGLAFGTEYPIDDEIIDDKFKKASTVTDVIKRRRAEEARAHAS